MSSPSKPEPVTTAAPAEAATTPAAAATTAPAATTTAPAATTAPAGGVKAGDQLDEVMKWPDLMHQTTAASDPMSTSAPAIPQAIADTKTGAPGDEIMYVKLLKVDGFVRKLNMFSQGKYHVERIGMEKIHGDSGNQHA